MSHAVTIATMGPTGTYSETAARKYALQQGYPQPNLVFGPTEQCLAKVADGQADIAVVPAENMVDGLIGSTYDALIEFSGRLQIMDELFLPVEHALAALKGMEETCVIRVYSHPSALNQCTRNLYAVLPDAVLIPVGSTAEAAARIAEHGFSDAAAICSPETADSYGLKVIRTSMSDYPQNQTRFFICGRGNATMSGHDVTSVAVRYGRNQPGQLYRTAGFFARRSVDLTAVHSRPYKIRPQEYVILFELTGHRDEDSVRGALEDVAAQVRETGGWLLVLGSHPRRGLG